MLHSAGNAGNPFVIPLEIAPPGGAEEGWDSAGGIIAADVNNDGLMDYLVTVRGHIGAYGNDGGKLWMVNADIQVDSSSESFGLPGHNAPGIQAGDIDADSKTEVLYLTRDSILHVLDGKTAREKWSAHPSVPEGAERWEHPVIANFRGLGDRDLLLQATNATGYRVGRYLAAYAVEDLKKAHYTPLWQRDDFLACAHNGARVADLDGDGKDEVLGGTIVSPDGNILFAIPLKGHIDSIYAYDLRPDIPGLEVVALEEGGGNRIFLYNARRLIWQTHYKRQEPQNATVGDFAPEKPGLEVWCRSRYNEHQKPFVFDSNGRLIADYEMDAVAPEGWTVAGVEIITVIHWTGEPMQLAAATERHTRGDIAIFNPVSGEFIERFKEKADRLYVADVLGDWREEIIVLNGSELHIYRNEKPNPNPGRPRLWKQAHYRRSKMTYNYYSP